MKYNLCVKRFTEMTALVSIKAAVSWELGLVLQNMIVSCQDQEGGGEEGIKFLVLVSRVLARWHAAQHSTSLLTRVMAPIIPRYNQLLSKHFPRKES